MPRGGGFRGGGFRGGGFRGGGFRGGPAGFRMGGIRPGGAPFGRTGASRIVSRSPRGPYRHTYYHPHRRYYWYGYRPWYWRWWYSPWWAGHWYRPWYYSPVYIGGGIFFFIILGLIILPLFQIGIWFPFSNADSSGTVAYRSTEVIGFNEYWYEHEYIEGGNDITYSVQSSISPISFAIWDQPFENLPFKPPVHDNDTFDDILLLSNWYEYYFVFLKPGSSISYNFNITSGSPIEFFITDASNLVKWNDNDPTASFFYQSHNTMGESGIFSNIVSAQDYYLVWYNENPSSTTIDIVINYTAVNVIDLTAADVFYEETYSVSQDTFTVPNDGDWYFFIFFDPLFSLEESTTITFDVTYDTGVTYTERWQSIQWILIIILVVIIIVIIAAFAARKGQKTASLKAKKEQKAEPPKAVKEEVKVETKKCPRCNFDIKPDANFCPKCGSKIEGRSIGSSEITTPAEAKTCSFCGSKLSETSNFCPWCGTPKQKTDQSIKKI
ncbi:MAG: zinc-ribbon domain-containing protein [Promethearchaeota archaeon]